MKEYTEKIEHFFSKHKNRWFDFFNENDPSRKDAERVLLSPIKESIFGLLKTVSIYENELPGVMAEKVRERIESLEKAIEETAKGLDTSNDFTCLIEFEDNAGDYTELKSFERDGKKIYYKEIRLNQSERDFGHCLATKLPEIDFWKWYLEDKFEQFEQLGKKVESLKENEIIKAPSKKDDPSAAVAPNHETTDPATGPTGQNPLSSLTYRQLALWCYYRQGAGEMERFDKETAFDFAYRYEKDGQNFYQKYWLTVPTTFKKETRHNLKDHKVILPYLENSHNAFQLAQNVFDFLKQKISM